jgi:hypothetical protein
MARYALSFVSQTAVAAGVNATTTLNGYLGALVGSATAGCRLRRVFLGVRAGASVPTSQQVSIAIYRQSVRVAGTGFTNQAGTVLDPSTGPSVITGFDVVTAGTAGTNGPTLAANPLHTVSFNTQSAMDIPAELLEEWIIGANVTSGLAFVNIGNALPASHLFTVSLEWEE